MGIRCCKNEEELNDHYRILQEGPGLEPNWCEYDDLLFAYEYLKRKLSDNDKELQMSKLHRKYWWRLWPYRFAYLNGWWSCLALGVNNMLLSSKYFSKIFDWNEP